MPAPEGIFDGPQQFAQWVREAFEAAAAEGWREMVWCDASFNDWPLREKAVVEHLNAWARSGRHLTLLALKYDGLRTLHPRFVSWRVTWDHIIDARVCQGVDASEFPSALWSAGWCLRRLDPVRCTGVAGTDARTRLLLRDALNELIRKSRPGFPASTLGL